MSDEIRMQVMKDALNITEEEREFAAKLCETIRSKHNINDMSSCEVVSQLAHGFTKSNIVNSDNAGLIEKLRYITAIVVNDVGLPAEERVITNPDAFYLGVRYICLLYRAVPAPELINYILLLYRYCKVQLVSIDLGRLIDAEFEKLKDYNKATDNIKK